MKNLISLILLILFVSAFSQQQSLLSGRDGFLYLNKTADLELELDDIEGSPYLNSSFMYAFVDNNTAKPYKLRYNVYKDEMEFARDGEIFYLDKNKYKTITFEPFKKYVVTNYLLKDINAVGFLVEVIDGENYGILKKEIIKFIPERTVSKGLSETHTPAQFKQQSDVYFVRLNDKSLVEMPTSKNKFAQLFKGKEKKIEKFMKENKTSLSDEKDLKELVEYINTL